MTKLCFTIKVSLSVILSDNFADFYFYLFIVYLFIYLFFFFFFGGGGGVAGTVFDLAIQNSL